MPPGDECRDCDEAAGSPRLAGAPGALHAQLELFAPEDLAPAEPAPRSRRKRLPRPLRAILDVIDRPGPAPARTGGTNPRADWLESFFDVGG